MKDSEFYKLRDIVMRETGISLHDEKKPLLANRLSKRLRALGIDSTTKYLEILETEHEAQELLEFVDAISTNVTSFYREADHYGVFASALQHFALERRDLKVWSAACSSGQEPYTLVMTAMEALDLSRVNVRFLATDICTRVLKIATEGVYRQDQAAQIPKHNLNRYFIREGKRDDCEYRVKPELRKLILFKRMNLSHFPYPLNGPFDVIFCRNVMIYFNVALRQKIIDSFYNLLRPGGYLFIGRSENLLGIKHNFRSCQSSVFVKS